MENTVAILMSTYNGAEFLEAQLNSILHQTDKSWHLYVRDDGSTDDTVKILRKFARNYSQITFVNDHNITNIGVVRSFMTLLKQTNAEFYMFSDQDDYWLPEKVAHTKKRMMEQPYDDQPVCVHTNLKIVDRSLNGNKLMNEAIPWHSFLKETFNNCITGCTLMINQQLKEFIDFDSLNYSNIYMHDWWLGMIGAAFGRLVYLNEATILYRQHGNNVVGSSKKTIVTMLHRIFDQSFDVGEFRKVIRNCIEFNNNYGNKLSGINKKYIREYALLAKKSSFLHNLHLLFVLPPKESSPKKTMFFAWLMLVHSRQLRISVGD